MGSIDWRAAAQWCGITAATVGLSLCAWLHGALIGHGDRLTTIETKEVAREKHADKDAAATAAVLQEIKTTAEKSTQELRGDLKELSRSVEHLRLELARSARPVTSGGMP